jgi:cold shock protein
LSSGIWPSTFSSFSKSALNIASAFFNEDRGYGFIVPDAGGSDVFMHVHEVEAAGMKTLVAGQLLTYDTAPARDGRTKAVNLRLLNPER